MVPFSTNTITDLNHLFGRDDIIGKLKAHANRRENIALIGTRRFGKTCLMRSFENYFRALEESPVYPIFMDFKEVDFIKGTDEVYRFIIAKMIAYLCADGYYTKSDDYKTLNVEPNASWEKNYEQLLGEKRVILNLAFREIILQFSELIDKTILFLIDEYEYLFTDSFSKPEGFMPMRALSSESGDKVKPFAFWIAGAIGWKRLCSLIGSSELNVINVSLSLMPLEKDDFGKMWKDEVSKCGNKDLEAYLMSKIDFAYEKTGGVPFYAKKLGAKLIVAHKDPGYSLLSDLFQQIDRTLEQGEMDILKEIAIMPKNLKESLHLRSLIEKGLIYKPDCSYRVRIGYYQDYLKALANSKPTNFQSEAKKLTKDIFGLFETINQQQKMNGHEVIFDSVSTDFTLQDNMSLLCQKSRDFQVFIGAVYLTFFEKTKKEGKAGEKLPTFVHHGHFGNSLDMLRHVYIGHIEDKMAINTGQTNKHGALLFFLGEAIEPYYPDDFSKLQLCILRKYKEVLNSLLLHCRKKK